nr:sulfatase-like hydrolase/transferase [Sinorhizobium meliloti]
MPMGSRAAPQGASFILGQEPFRMGLLTIGMPGDPHGIQDWMPTIADVMKSKDHATGQFGKNHLGERDEHLPTNHGFDEFFGNLYHLNAEEEPEGYFYPKDEEFRKNFGPRGVIESSADGKIEDTGAWRPSTRVPCCREGFHRTPNEGRQAVLPATRTSRSISTATSSPN